MGQGWYYDFMNPNSALKRALIENGAVFGLHYVKDICSVGVSIFRYKNIERIPNLTSEILETALMFNWNLCFYKLPGTGWVLCRYTYDDCYTYYMRPITVNLLALNGVQLASGVPYEDIILVRDNSMDVAPFICLVEYIQKIDKVDSSIFKALDVATLPLVITGNKKLVNQLNAVAKKLGSSESFIAADDTLVDAIKAFDIDVKINPLDIYTLKTKFKNECLASIGIYSVEEKKERKIVSEVAAQNDYVDHIYQDKKQQRLNFIDLLNKADPDLELELEETYWKNVEDTSKEIEITNPQLLDNGGNNNDTNLR